MYGMVNKAIEELVTERFGKTTWERILDRAGVNIETFIPMDAYPDSVTYDLVGAASAELGLPSDQLLEAFGEYWILFTAREGYGELMRLGGDSFPVFLTNLHDLHTRVALGFPHLQPPSFWLSEVSDYSLRLHYQSKRPGLAPMVLGLLTGLGKMFDTRVSAVHAVRREDGAAHDEFIVQFGTSA